MRNFKNSLIKSIKSFSFALSGIHYLFKSENNARYQLTATIATITLAFYLKVDQQEWLILIIMVGLVLMAEAFNTAIEKLCDHIHPDRHPQIGVIKDLAAGAVLLISVTAVIVGVIIFGSQLI